MPPARRQPALDLRVFRGSTAVRQGLLTANELRGPGWQRLFPDVYVAAGAPAGHVLRARAAAGLLLPGSVISGASAAVLWGLTDLAGPDDPVELTVAPGAARSSCPGVRIRRRRLAPELVRDRHGVRVTTPERTAVELAAGLDPVEGVVLLDRFVAEHLATLPGLRAEADAAVGRGCRRARQAATQADGLAGSPQETRLRLLLDHWGMPAPVAQFVVRHGGRFVGRVDFAWPERRVALEYEGAWHTRQIAADRRRIEALQAAGWRVLFVTAGDLAHPAALLTRLAAALAQ